MRRIRYLHSLLLGVSFFRMPVLHRNKTKKTAKDFTVRPFEKLRKKIEAAQPVFSPPPVPAPRNTAITEAELFSTAMDDVQEIEAFRDMPVARRPKKVVDGRERRDPNREALTILGEIAGGQRPIDLPDTQEYVEWMNPEFRGEIIKNLHAGRFSVQSFLDLHGCTVIEADMEVEAFLKDSFQKGFRCVKIIHGRGLRSPRKGRDHRPQAEARLQFYRPLQASYAGRDHRAGDGEGGLPPCGII